MEKPMAEAATTAVMKRLIIRFWEVWIRLTPKFSCKGFKQECARSAHTSIAILCQLQRSLYVTVGMFAGVFTWSGRIGTGGRVELTIKEIDGDRRNEKHYDVCNDARVERSSAPEERSSKQGHAKGDPVDISRDSKTTQIALAEQKNSGRQNDDRDSGRH